MTRQGVKFEKPKVIDYGFYNPPGLVDSYHAEWEASEGGPEPLSSWLMRDALFEHDKWEQQAVWADVCEEARIEVEQMVKDKKVVDELLNGADEAEL